MKRTRVGMLIFPDVERLVNINASAPSRPFPAPPFPGHHASGPAHRSPAGAAGTAPGWNRCEPPQLTPVAAEVVVDVDHEQGRTVAEASPRAVSGRGKDALSRSVRN